MHTADEIGIDDFQSSRSPDNRYRTTPLKGAWSHARRAASTTTAAIATLLAVVAALQPGVPLRLSDSEMNDLVEYLKSL